MKTLIAQVGIRPDGTLLTPEALKSMAESSIGSPYFGQQGFKIGKVVGTEIENGRLWLNISLDKEYLRREIIDRINYNYRVNNNEYHFPSTYEGDVLKMVKQLLIDP